MRLLVAKSKELVEECIATRYDADFKKKVAPEVYDHVINHLAKCVRLICREAGDVDADDILLTVVGHWEDCGKPINLNGKVGNKMLDQWEDMF